MRLANESKAAGLVPRNSTEDDPCSRFVAFASALKFNPNLRLEGLAASVEQTGNYKVSSLHAELIAYVQTLKAFRDPL